MSCRVAATSGALLFGLGTRGEILRNGSIIPSLVRPVRLNGGKKGSGMSDTFVIQEKNEIPMTAVGRIAELKKLSLKEKQAFIPPVGADLRIGPYVYRVNITNVSQLRFSCSLHDVIIEGVNDTEPVIIDPNKVEAE